MFLLVKMRFFLSVHKLIIYNFLAAHCIRKKFSLKVRKAKFIKAIFGAHDLDSTDEIGRYELKPIRTIVHEDWNSTSTQYDADLAILRFNRNSIKFNMFVQPLCLWKFENEPIETSGTVVGWGQRENTTKKHENLPTRIFTPIHSDRQCLAGNSQAAGVSSLRTFCAGLRNGTGICNGDSGGALFIVVEGVFYLRGIVSGSPVTFYNECDTFENAQMS